MLVHAIQGLVGGILMFLCGDYFLLMTLRIFLVFLLIEYYFVSIFTRFELLKHCFFPFQLAIS